MEENYEIMEQFLNDQEIDMTIKTELVNKLIAGDSNSKEEAISEMKSLLNKQRGR